MEKIIQILKSLSKFDNDAWCLNILSQTLDGRKVGSNTLNFLEGVKTAPSKEVLMYGIIAHACLWGECFLNGECICSCQAVASSSHNNIDILVWKTSIIFESFSIPFLEIEIEIPFKKGIEKDEIFQSLLKEIERNGQIILNYIPFK